MSLARHTVHTNSSRKRSFSKTLFKPEEFENTGVQFSCGRKTFWKWGFWKPWRHDNHVIFKHKSNTTADCCFFKFLRCIVDGKHLMYFQSGTCVFKFIWHSVDSFPNVLDKNVNIALPLGRSNLSYYMAAIVRALWLAAEQALFSSY